VKYALTTIIPADGSGVINQEWEGSGPDLKWLQNAVGGLIERVPIAPSTMTYPNWNSESPDYRVTMWVHEEALLRNNPVRNETASMMALQPIFGDAVVVEEWFQ